MLWSFMISLTKTISKHFCNCVTKCLEIQCACFIYFRVPVVLVGNKTDLYSERTVSAEEGRRLAESWNAQFLETSAKQNEVRCNKNLF